MTLGTAHLILVPVQSQRKGLRARNEKVTALLLLRLEKRRELVRRQSKNPDVNELKYNLLAPWLQTENIRHQARIGCCGCGGFLEIDRPAH